MQNRLADLHGICRFLQLEPVRLLSIASLPRCAGTSSVGARRPSPMLLPIDGAVRNCPPASLSRQLDDKKIFNRFIQSDGPGETRLQVTKGLLGA